MKRIAAAIEYEVTARPSAVRDDYLVAPEADVTYMTIAALDGFKVEAALQQPRSKQAGDTVLVIAVHGSGDSYDKDPDAFLAPMLAARGYAVLGINTRQARDKVNTDNFMSVRRDIDAAVHTARALGYRRLVLSGHSLGNIQVQYYAANNWDADICGVILLGMFANLPWKSRNILVQNEAHWAQLEAASMSALRNGTAADVLPLTMKNYSGHDVAITAQHFLTYRSEASSAADGTWWIRRIPFPILMVRDEADALVHRFEPNMLVSAAQSPGSLVQGITSVLLANDRPASAQAHYFVDSKHALVESITAWLAGLMPRP